MDWVRATARSGSAGYKLTDGHNPGQTARRHSGMGVAMALALAAGGAAQQPGFEVLLRDGTAVPRPARDQGRRYRLQLQVDGKGAAGRGGGVLALCGARGSGRRCR